MAQPGETYLYDGVYASYVSGMIVLRAPRYDEATNTVNDHYIYLDQEGYNYVREFGRAVLFELPDEDAPS